MKYDSVPALVGEALIRGLAMAMAAGCALAFVVTYFISRERRQKVRD